MPVSDYQVLPEVQAACEEISQVSTSHVDSLTESMDNVPALPTVTWITETNLCLPSTPLELELILLPIFSCCQLTLPAVGSYKDSCTLAKVTEVE